MSKGAPVLLATTIFVLQESGNYKQFHRGEAVPGLDDEQIERLTKCGALANKSSDEGKDAGAGVDNAPAAAVSGTLVTEPSAFVFDEAAVSEVPAPPLKTAPVADWREYAVGAHGVSEAEAADLTKPELIELYGG